MQKNPSPQFKNDWIYGLIDILAAGSETTSTSVIWSLVAIAQHPEVGEKVYEEIKAILGDRSPTFEDMKNMHYTRAAINESQRFFPLVVLSLPRIVSAEDGEVKIGGYDIPKGTLVFLNWYEMYVADSNNYWKNPEIFSPERFLSKENTLEDNNLQIFGEGPRNCIGKSLAEVEVFLMVVSLAQNFIFELQENYKWEIELGLTTRPKGNSLKMKITPRL